MTWGQPEHRAKPSPRSTTRSTRDQPAQMSRKSHHPLCGRDLGETERIIGSRSARPGPPRHADRAPQDRRYGNRRCRTATARRSRPKASATALEGSPQPSAPTCRSLPATEPRLPNFRRQSFTQRPRRRPRRCCHPRHAERLRDARQRAMSVCRTKPPGDRHLDSRRASRPAARRVDPERIQSGLPAVRSRPRRALPPRGCRAAGLLAARGRVPHRQRPGVPAAGSRAAINGDLGGRILGPFRSRSCRPIMRSRARPRARPERRWRWPSWPRLCRLGDPRRDDHGAAPAPTSPPPSCPFARTAAGIADLYRRHPRPF